MRPVLTENISRQWIVTSFYQGRIYIPDFINTKIYTRTKNDVAMHWQQMVPGENWSLVGC